MRRKGGERLESREIYPGRTIHVAVDKVRLPNGKVMDVELVHHKGAVAVVPVIGDDVLLIRHSLGATTWGERRKGDRVNLEVDTIARYAARLVEAAATAT